MSARSLSTSASQFAGDSTGNNNAGDDGGGGDNQTLDEEEERHREETKPKQTGQRPLRPRLAALRKKLRGKTFDLKEEAAAARKLKLGQTREDETLRRRAWQPGYEINNSETALEARRLYVSFVSVVLKSHQCCPLRHTSFMLFGGCSFSCCVVVLVRYQVSQDSPGFAADAQCQPTRLYQIPRAEGV